MKDDRLRIWIDGACEPINPGGTASYGLVIKHGDEILFSKGAIVGTGKDMSNNVAEYSGLLAFIEWYLSSFASLVNRILKRRPAVYSDSQLLINQMTGEWRVKKGLYVPTYRKVVTLIRENNLDIGYRWVPREENEEADYWSKKALKEAGIRFAIQKE